MRPGVDKVSFVKLGFDSILGITFQTYSISYQDRYLIPNRNGAASTSTLANRTVTRTINVPDIIITAADLGTDATTGFPIVAEFTVAWVKSAQLAYTANPNLVPPSGIAGGVPGPGTIDVPRRIGLSKIGPTYSRTFAEGDAARFFLWSTFDGTTNLPVIYPKGTSVREVESAIIRAGGR